MFAILQKLFKSFLVDPVLLYFMLLRSPLLQDDTSYKNVQKTGPVVHIPIVLTLLTLEVAAKRLSRSG